MLQVIKTKTKNLNREKFEVIEYKDRLRVKKGKKTYELHPLMYLISDRTKLYASAKNDKRDLYSELRREIKRIPHENIAIIYWLPYKPKQKITGEIINNKFYDNKRAIKLKDISLFYKTFNSERN